MTTNQHILDNRHGSRVFEYLKPRLERADQLRIVSAYFSIYGYQLLQDELQRIATTKFLFGDPTSVGEVDPGEKQQKSFSLDEDGLTPNHQLQQKALARQCHQWVSRPGVEIRSVSRSNFLHGKMYLSIADKNRDENGRTVAAVTGSSNFTRRGLGGSQNANLELNLITENAATCNELKDWFDEIWNDKKLTEDAKQEVLDALNRLGQNYAPEHIYFKTLYEIFREDIEAKRDGDRKLEDTHLYDTRIWHALYEFQKDGVRSVISKLRRHSGCILADSVGLGKTYTALAVIKYFELLNERVLVLCPKKLNGNWALYPASNNQTHNPFIEDRFGYTLLSHTDLSRYSGKIGSIDLSSFNWRNFDLLVIDESHNFRNDSNPVRDDNGKILRHSRYSRLLEEVIKAGGKTKVLLLSATPVNTSLIDLRNQIYLMTEKREDAFSESLGISNIGNLLRQAQKQFKAWEDKARQDGTREKALLLEKLGADFFKLLTGISIARSRRQIQQFYADEIDKIGKFPARKKPENLFPQTDSKGELSYQKLAEQIEQFALSIYQPSFYVISAEAEQRLQKEKQERRFNQRDRERFLIGMIRINFLKRLESSAYSLTQTLQRTIAKIHELLDKIALYEQTRDLNMQVVEPDADEDDEEFLINKARTPYHLRELDLPRWKQDLLKDREYLSNALSQVAAITPERDGKLEVLKKQVWGKAQCPTTDRDGRANRKLLVFTTFKDTAEYLYQNMEDLTAELGLNMAMVSGDLTRTQSGANDFNSILSNFAPRARQQGNSTDDEIDLLIATDCISEGQNLQDCDQTINYDIHWNPVRIIQRFGRIDRIGSRNQSVGMVNFWPTQDMEAYLRLKGRVEARMALVDATASADDDLLAEQQVADEIQLELNFRDEQLKKLSQEALDLDELPDGIGFSDFTLDYFFTQLLRYLEKNKEVLENTPKGAYAVTSAAEEDTQAGVLFVLRQTNAGTDNREKVASPVQPFYLVHVRANGDVRHGCAHARQILEFFEAVTSGKSEPLQALCDKFDAETQHGKNMTHYDKLLNAAIRHINAANTKTLTSALAAGGPRNVRIPAKSSNSAGNFELITWLVISNEDSELSLNR